MKKFVSRGFVSRRLVLRGFGAAVAAAPLAPLFGCHASRTPANDNDGGAGGTGGTTSADAATETAAETDTAVAWATGGTAAMSSKANYPDPFASAAAPTTCAATCAATPGPCYSAQSVEIQDISYGYAGLPTRLTFRVLDEACQPLVGASVDVWHVSAVGKYSGNDSKNENVAFCTGNDADFTSHVYFRGKQTTNAKGVAFFDTCYPGWYSGRTVHVHFTVRVGDTAYVTSQFFFDDALNDDILGSQALYNSRGARTTTNSNDSVVAAASAAAYSFETQKMPDGALLAWKTIIVRGATSSALCTIPGGGASGMGGGGMGGPPPGV